MSIKKSCGKEVNRTELAEVFGVAMTTIDNWVRGGCPVIERGSKGVSWIFNTADVAAWRESLARSEVAKTADVGMDELKRRKLAAQTMQAELEFATAKGLVAPVRQFEDALIAVFSKVRARLRQIPPRTALLVLGNSNEAAVRSIIAREIDEALRELGTASLLSYDDFPKAD
jgi:phage terminase Nu1 subunit (DNA packaging protein)